LWATIKEEAEEAYCFVIHYLGFFGLQPVILKIFSTFKKVPLKKIEFLWLPIPEQLFKNSNALIKKTNLI